MGAHHYFTSDVIILGIYSGRLTHMTLKLLKNEKCVPGLSLHAVNVQLESELPDLTPQNHKRFKEILWQIIFSNVYTSGERRLHYLLRNALGEWEQRRFPDVLRPIMTHPVGWMQPQEALGVAEAPSQTGCARVLRSVVHHAHAGSRPVASSSSFAAAPEAAQAFSFVQLAPTLLLCLGFWMREKASSQRNPCFLREHRLLSSGADNEGTWIFIQSLPPPAGGAGQRRVMALLHISMGTFKTVARHRWRAGGGWRNRMSRVQPRWGRKLKKRFPVSPVDSSEGKCVYEDEMLGLCRWINSGVKSTHLLTNWTSCFTFCWHQSTCLSTAPTWPVLLPWGCRPNGSFSVSREKMTDEKEFVLPAQTK